jgi:nicotinamidase/pyrazinamidase
MTFTIEPERDALLIVDVQNDFCPTGALGVPGGDEVVPVLNGYAERFAAARATVIATRDWHPEKTMHFEAYGGVWPVHCVQETPGAAFHPGLVLPPGTEVFSKGADPETDSYSAFQSEGDDGTPFAAVLAERGVARLFVGGLATDYCVRESALDALRAGFEVVILEDAVRAVDLKPGDGERALDAIAAAGGRRACLDSVRAT